MVALTFLRAAGNAALSFLFQRGGWKIVLIVLGLLMVALSAAWVVRDHYTAKAAEAAIHQAQEENRVLTQAASAGDRAVTGVTQAKAALAQKETTGLARTHAALDAHPDWAQQPIPADVLDSLRE